MDLSSLPARLTGLVTAADFDSLEALCAPDMIGEWVGVGRVKGRDAFVNTYRNDHDQFSDFRAEVTEVFACDNHSVSFRGRGSGRHTGRIAKPEGGVIEPTGKTFEFQFLSVIECADGKISRVLFGFNPAEIWRQLGAEP